MKQIGKRGDNFKIEWECLYISEEAVELEERQIQLSN